MFIYILIYILLAGLALTYGRMDRYSRSLSFGILSVFFFFFAALRGQNVDKDYLSCYCDFCNSIPSLSLLFSDIHAYFKHLPEQEFSFCLLVSFFKLFATSPMRWVAFVYAVLGVSLKMKAIKKLSPADVCGYAFLFYFCHYFILQEMTQIRVGVAMALFLLALPYAVERKFWPFLGIILLAGFIHRSAFIGFFVYFLSNKTFNPYFWFPFLFFLIVMAVCGFDLCSLLSYIPIHFIQNKFQVYSLTQDWQEFHITFFRFMFIPQILVTIILYIYREKIKIHFPYLLLFLKINLLSLLCFYGFIRFPVFSYRLSDFFGGVTIILLPLLYYIIKPKWVSHLSLLAIALVMLSIDIFHVHLLRSYYVFFFD